jgi:t-SNARE complex subunit (syntaxin)
VAPDPDVDFDALGQSDAPRSKLDSSANIQRAVQQASALLRKSRDRGFIVVVVVVVVVVAIERAPC